jgi:hypothetical protein
VLTHALASSPARAGSGVCEVCNVKAWDLAGTDGFADEALLLRPRHGRTAGREGDASTGECLNDSRVKHVFAATVCTVVVAFAVFGAPALARASLSGGGSAPTGGAG